MTSGDETKTGRQLIRGAWEQYKQFEDLRHDKVNTWNNSNKILYGISRFHKFWRVNPSVNMHFGTVPS
jgi:hypothetical protein